MTIDKLIRNTKAVDIREVVASTMQKDSAALVDAQQLQMLEGLNADGGKIGKYKNKYYARKKFMMNSFAGFGNVDLRFEGVFQSHIKIYFFSTAFFFKSTDEKNLSLVKKYGENIYGLNNVSIKRYSGEHLKPKATKEITNKILKA